MSNETQDEKTSDENILTFTRSEWKKIHRDYKGWFEGHRSVLRLDPKTGWTRIYLARIVKD